MLLGINHIQITIPEGREKEAKYFYCSLLGLQEIEKPDRLKANGGFWIQLSDIQIHVGVENGVDRNRTKAHIAYEVSDIDFWKSKLEINKVAVKNSQPVPDVVRIEFRDPFGNKVELIEKRR